MSRNNREVSQVLIADPAVAVATVGQSITDLTVGQYGIFDADSNLAIATGATPRAIYLGVGLTHDGSDATDAVKSNPISLSSLYAAQFRAYTPYQSGVHEITDIAPDAETEYQIKVRVRGNQTMANQGARERIKSYSVVTSCTSDCSGCQTGDCLDLAVKLAKEIAADADNLFTVVLVDNANKSTYGGAIAGTEIATTDQAAIDAFIATGTPTVPVCLLIRLYENASSCNTYCGIIENSGLNYESAGLSTTITSIVGTLGFEDCNSGTFTKVRDITYEETSANDAQVREYWTQGWESGPYRQTRSGISLVGLNRTVGYRPANCTGYHSLMITWNVKEFGGFHMMEGQPNTLNLLIPNVATAANVTAFLLLLDEFLGTSTSAEYAAADPTTATVEDAGTGPIDTAADDA